jgi:hypothetical protein
MREVDLVAAAIESTKRRQTVPTPARKPFAAILNENVSELAAELVTEAFEFLRLKLELQAVVATLDWSDTRLLDPRLGHIFSLKQTVENIREYTSSMDAKIMESELLAAVIEKLNAQSFPRSLSDVGIDKLLSGQRHTDVPPHFNALKGYVRVMIPHRESLTHMLRILRVGYEPNAQLLLATFQGELKDAAKAELTKKYLAVRSNR